MNAKQVINIGIALGVAGILIYLGEENSTLVVLAIIGIAYLLFSGRIFSTIGV